MSSAPVLADELAAVRGELARIDAKCSTLTALAGAGVAFLASRTGASARIAAEPVAVPALLAAAGVALTAAVSVLLLTVLRPRLAGRVGFCRYAPMTSAAEVRRTVVCDNEAERRSVDVLVLSRIAARKYRRMRLAVDLLAAGVALLGAAAIVG